MAVTYFRNKFPRSAIDRERLESMALAYAGRYAVTRAKLRSYLDRKIRERGWAGEGEPPIEVLVLHFAELGYVDDSAFAAARAASLGHRGYGERRVTQALRAAGVEEEEAKPALEEARRGAWAAALRFAERRKIGPFAPCEMDRAAREKGFAALIRAGHSFAVSRRIADARPGEIPDPDQ